jgi:hypothetical protein
MASLLPKTLMMPTTPNALHAVCEGRHCLLQGWLCVGWVCSEALNDKQRLSPPRK